MFARPKCDQNHSCFRFPLFCRIRGFTCHSEQASYLTFRATIGPLECNALLTAHPFTNAINVIKALFKTEFQTGQAPLK